MKKSKLAKSFGFFIQIGFFIGTFLSFNTALAADDTNARETVMKGAEVYVTEQLSYQQQGKLAVKASSLDKRLSIPNCPQPIEYSASPESLRLSNISVKASCPEKNWYIYLVVRASLMQQVVIASQTISPGTTITASHVEMIEMDKKLIRSSTYADIQDVVGARLKKRTRAGQPIAPTQLCFVCKGDKVTISANANGLKIKTKGIAQQDGNLGDTITVKNRRSNKTVYAQVVNQNEVLVDI